MARPRYSISQVSTFGASFEEDLDAYAAAGCEGIGIWEYKVPAGRESELRDRLEASGLAATICVPDVPTFVFDGYFSQPQDPGQRLAAMLAGIRRLAAFRPDSILLMSGDPANAAPGETRRLTVAGLRAAGDVAGESGIIVGFEPLRRASGGLVSTLPDAFALIDEVGHPNVRVVVDTWHLWATDGFLELLRSASDRLAGVQICDIREPTRSWCDRVLPGDGVIDFGAVFRALEAGGYDGWYDLEIFSDDGRFGMDLPDSLWRIPAGELARASRERFDALWDGRTAVSPR